MTKLVPLHLHLLGLAIFFIIIHVIIYVEYPTKLLKKTN